MKTVLFFILSMLSLSIHAQIEYGEFNGRKKNQRDYEPPKESEQTTWSIKNKTDSLDYELYCMRYYLEKYREQTSKGRRVMVTGAMISIASIAFAERSSNLSIAGTCLGGTVFAIGGIINWSSGRWLRYATIKPTTYGVSLTIPF
jgi:hypothetical protein